MQARNPVNGSISGSEQQVICKNLYDFRIQYRKYRSNPNDENRVSILRSVSYLSTISSHQFNLRELKTALFFVDLHGLIGELGDSDVLWTCISLLQNCSKNAEVRKALVEGFRFVPLLTSVLNRTQLLTEKATRLLTLLQDLTFGICIRSEKPYVNALLDLLQRTVTTATEEGEEKQAILALSVIMNLCYKNIPVISLFIRSFDISEFIQKIQHYGVLANKMIIILSEYVHPELQKNHNMILHLTFASILQCLREWNVTELRYIVDFLTDSESHKGLHRAMLQYANYCEDIERWLVILEDNSNMNDSNEETRKQRQLCLSLMFKLILYILKLSSISDGNENIISLDSKVPRIFDLICHWIESDICGADAVQLLDGLIHFAKGESLTSRMARDPSIVIQLITISENPDTSSEHTIAILQLLLSLLHQKMTENLILSIISESFFDKILSPNCTSATHIIPAQEIDKTVFCLLLLVNFAGIAKKEYFEKCCTTLQMPEIQSALAYATLNSSETVCNAVFQIAKFEHFPGSAVAKRKATLNASSTQFQSTSTAIHCGTQQFQNVNSTETEERLEALIETISSAQRINQLNSVPTSQIMELYDYKLEKFKRLEKRMQRDLDRASDTITDLTQMISLQNAELEKYHKITFELQIKIQSTETKRQDLKKQCEELTRKLKDQINKHSKQLESLQICQNQLSVKTSELNALSKEHTDLQEEMILKREQPEKLEGASKEYVAKIDMLKTVSAFETEIEDLKRTLEQKERELVKLNKALEAEQEAKNGYITVLEGQLQEKDEEMRNYERKIEEVLKTMKSLLEPKLRS